MTATRIPLRDLHLAWPTLWPLLEPAVKRTPDKPDVLARLMARDAQLWAVYEGEKAIAAIVTQITPSTPSSRSYRALATPRFGRLSVRSTSSLRVMLAASLLLCGLSTAGYRSGGADGRPPPPQRLLNPCKRPADRPDPGDDRDLAAWEAETWQRGHYCADRVMVGSNGGGNGRR